MYNEQRRDLERRYEEHMKKRQLDKVDEPEEYEEPEENAEEEDPLEDPDESQAVTAAVPRCSEITSLVYEMELNVRNSVPLPENGKMNDSRVSGSKGQDLGAAG